MQGDFSRLTFDPTLNYTQVLWQQGRPLVDADLNEQSSILLHYLRRLTADVIGWHGGPGVVKDTSGPFWVKVITEGNDKGKFGYEKGRYYVDGWMVETGGGVADGWGGVMPESTKNRLVFLDVWPSVVPSESPADSALGCPPPTLRSKLNYKVWVANVEADPTKFKNQAKMLSVMTSIKGTDTTLNLRGLDAAASLPKLKAFCNTPKTSDNGACAAAASADAGPSENRLYRVEIHRGCKFNVDSEGKVTIKDDPITFKWSRDYCSAVLQANRVNGEHNLVVTSDAARKSLKKDDWVEIVAEGEDTGVFAEISEVKESGDKATTLTFNEQVALQTWFDKHSDVNAAVSIRLWDHKQPDKEKLADGAIKIEWNTKGESNDCVLEEGLGVRFQFDVPRDENGKLIANSAVEFRPGDYWLIPARANGSVLWPNGNDGKPSFVPAQYVEHRYAPLALIDSSNKVTDLRNSLVHLGVAPVPTPPQVAASTLRRTHPNSASPPTPNANEAAALSPTGKKSSKSNSAKKRTTNPRGKLHKAANAAVAKVRILARVAKHAAKGAPKPAPKTAAKPAPKKPATATARPATKKNTRTAKKKIATLVASTARRTTKPRKKPRKKKR